MRTSRVHPAHPRGARFYAGAIYPRHISSFPQFGPHGFWTTRALVEPRPPPSVGPESPRALHRRQGKAARTNGRSTAGLSSPLRPLRAW